MPTPNDPIDSALAARDALRRLAATKPHDLAAQDVYTTLGALSHTLSALRSSLAVLADWHRDNAGHATVNGRGDLGQATTADVTSKLTAAADGINRAAHVLDHAWSANGQIAFSPVPQAEPARRLPQRSHGLGL